MEGGTARLEVFGLGGAWDFVVSAKGLGFRV